MKKLVMAVVASLLSAACYAGQDVGVKPEAITSVKKMFELARPYEGTGSDTKTCYKGLAFGYDLETKKAIVSGKTICLKSMDLSPFIDVYAPDEEVGAAFLNSLYVVRDNKEAYIYVNPGKDSERMQIREDDKYIYVKRAYTTTWPSYKILGYGYAIYPKTMAAGISLPESLEAIDANADINGPVEAKPVGKLMSELFASAAPVTRDEIKIGKFEGVISLAADDRGDENTDILGFAYGSVEKGGLIFGGKTLKVVYQHSPRGVYEYKGDIRSDGASIAARAGFKHAFRPEYYKDSVVMLSYDLASFINHDTKSSAGDVYHIKKLPDGGYIAQIDTVYKAGGAKTLGYLIFK